MSFTSKFDLEKPSYGTNRYDVPINADMDLLDTILGCLDGYSGFRLTAVSGDPAPNSDQKNFATLHLTPFVGDRISLLTAAGKVEVLQSAEISKSLTGLLTSGYNHDVFVYNNTGALALNIGAAWTSDTARSAAIEKVGGAWYLTSDNTYRYVGTLRATGTGTTSDEDDHRYLWNLHNRLPRSLHSLEAATSWSYATATVRQAGGSASNGLHLVRGLDLDPVCLEIVCAVLNDSTAQTGEIIGFGVDSTTVMDAASSVKPYNIASNVLAHLVAKYDGMPGLGYHALNWLEKGAGSGTQTWYSGSGGLQGVCWA